MVRGASQRVTRCRRKFQGFGFVEFEDVRDADEAVRVLDGNSFGGRTITVRVWERKDWKGREQLGGLEGRSAS